MGDYDVFPSEDPNGIFPTPDGIPPYVPPNLPPGFDLRQLLSESMRARPAWNDMAAAASRVMYEYVERNRLALNQARQPEVLDRTLKIATLRMLGLDWGSDLLEDADYDRVLEAVSAYMQHQGPQTFVKFMGFALGVPLDLMPLWTRDYANFVPDVPADAQTVFDDPDTGYYPTSHVDLAYEEFAARAVRFGDPGVQVDLTGAFYRLAPINLVLRWIVAQITLSVGTIYASLNIYEVEELQTPLVDYPNQMVLLLCPQEYDKELCSVTIEPLYPNRQIPSHAGFIGSLLGKDYGLAGTSGAWFAPGYGTSASGLVTYYVSSGWVPSPTVGGGIRTSTSPDPSWISYGEGSTGLLVLPRRTCSILNPTSVQTLVTVAASVSAGPSLPDGSAGSTVTSLATGGYIAAQYLDEFTGAISLAYHPHSNQQVRIARGSQWVQASVNSGVATVTADSSTTDFGCLSMGGGYWLLWGLMAGTDVTVYPGHDVVGAIDWLYLQAEDASRPSPQGPEFGLQSPFVREGVQLGFSPDVMQRPYGQVICQAYQPFFKSSATYTLFQAMATSTENVSVGVEAGSVYASMEVGGRQFYAIVGTMGTGRVAFEVSWQPGSVTITTATGAATFPASLPANLATNSLFAYSLNPTVDTWVLEVLVAQGAMSSDQLPGSSVASSILSGASGIV